jgi:peptidoglycan/xylan/chitin deacetylase (PgdA/CDA1 family)
MPHPPSSSNDSFVPLTLPRRGFLGLAAASLASCTQASPIPDFSDKRPTAPAEPRPMRNPDMSLSSEFSRSAGITFTRLAVHQHYIAMTFDDGPHPQNTPRLLDILRARNIKATFYVIGRSVNAHPHIVRRTAAEGHEIGNHSQTHRLLTRLGDAELRNEFARCRDAVQRAAGVRMRTMRPPYGGLSQRQRELAHREFGYPTILWSVDPLDWRRPGAGVITSRILAGTRPGGIILAHDLHAQTVDAMPATLDGLLRRGYRFVTVSQLIAISRADERMDAIAMATPGA